MGIGFAAIRDIVAFLRRAAVTIHWIRRSARAGLLAFTKRRVLRDLVYYGFNQDLAGRKVFDGIMPVVAGSRRTCITGVRSGRPVFRSTRIIPTMTSSR